MIILYPSFTYYFYSQMISLWNSFSILSICIVIFHRRSLYTLCYCEDYVYWSWRWQKSGLILGLHPANERRRYKVTSSLIGWVQTYNQPWKQHIWYIWSHSCFVTVGDIGVRYTYWQIDEPIFFKQSAHKILDIMKISSHYILYIQKKNSFYFTKKYVHCSKVGNR